MVIYLYHILWYHNYMITIIHGEHIVKSRDALVNLITSYKQKGYEIQRLNAKNIELGALESALISQDLFGSDRVLVIEGLHSTPRSTKKNQLIDAVAQSQIDVVLWEQRELTKTMLKAFLNATTQYFKLTSDTFNWLDSLNGSGTNRELSVKLFHQALKQEDAFFLLIMMARQVRLLIQSIDGGVIKGPPFVVSKLKKQASSFSLQQLVTIHSALLEIDYAQKTSSKPLTLEQELDLLQLNM
jgi:DNA polymerase III delta subunit